MTDRTDDFEARQDRGEVKRPDVRLLALWERVVARIEAVGYYGGSASSRAADRYGDAVRDHLDPRARRRSVLLTVRLAAGLDDELYERALRDLENAWDVIGLEVLDRWAQSHPGEQVLASLRVLLKEKSSRG